MSTVITLGAVDQNRRTWAFMHQRSPADAWGQLRNWIPRTCLVIQVVAYGSAAVVRSLGGGEWWVPASLALIAVTSVVMIAEMLRWWDAVRPALDRPSEA